MASANSTRAEKRASAIGPSDANPLIGDTTADTISRVQAVLRYMAFVAGGSTGTAPNDEDSYGMSLILDTCATALDFPMKGGAA